MAVTQVTEVRKPQLSYISKNGRRTYHVFFDQYTDYNTMFEQAATAVDPNSGPSIPQEGTNFDGQTAGDNDPIVTDIEIQLYSEQNKIIEVTVTFSNQDDAKDGNTGGGTNVTVNWPWQERKIVSWGTKTVERVMHIDMDDNAILNSSGQPFDELVTRPVAVGTVSVSWKTKVGGFSPSTGFVNTINDGTFSIAGNKFDPETALCTNYGGTLINGHANGRDISYYQVTASWDYLDDGSDWDGIILDIGHQEYDAETQTFYPILDKHSRKMTSPQLLNGGGRRLIRKNGGKHPLESDSFGLPVNSSLSNTDRVFLNYKQFKKTNHRKIL